MTKCNPRVPNGMICKPMFCKPVFSKGQFVQKIFVNHFGAHHSTLQLAKWWSSMWISIIKGNLNRIANTEPKLGTNSPKITDKLSLWRNGHFWVFFMKTTGTTRMRRQVGRIPIARRKGLSTGFAEITKTTKITRTTRIRGPNTLGSPKNRLRNTQF